MITNRDVTSIVVKLDEAVELIEEVDELAILHILKSHQHTCLPEW